MNAEHHAPPNAQNNAGLDRFFAIDDRLSMLMIVADYAAVITIITIAVTLHHPLATLLAMALVAGRQVAFLNLVHAAAHYTLFSRRHANNRVDVLIGYLILDAVRPYRSYHLQHHRDFARKTPDRFDYLSDQLPEPDAGRAARMWAVIFKPLLGAAGVDFVRATADELRASLALAAKLAAYWTVVVALCWRAGWLQHLVVYWVVPLVWLYPAFYFWAEMTDHYAVRDEARNQRGLFYALFIKGHEMYHAVHHRYPRIPFYRVRAASQYLESMGEHFEETGNIVDFLGILSRPRSGGRTALSGAQSVNQRG